MRVNRLDGRVAVSRARHELRGRTQRPPTTARRATREDRPSSWPRSAPPLRRSWFRSLPHIGRPALSSQLCLGAEVDQNVRLFAMSTRPVSARQAERSRRSTHSITRSRSGQAGTSSCRRPCSSERVRSATAGAPLSERTGSSVCCALISVAPSAGRILMAFESATVMKAPFTNGDRGVVGSDG